MTKRTETNQKACDILHDMLRVVNLKNPIRAFNYKECNWNDDEVEIVYTNGKKRDIRTDCKALNMILDIVYYLIDEEGSVGIKHSTPSIPDNDADYFMGLEDLIGLTSEASELSILCLETNVSSDPGKLDVTISYEDGTTQNLTVPDDGLLLVRDVLKFIWASARERRMSSIHNNQDACNRLCETLKDVELKTPVTGILYNAFSGSRTMIRIVYKDGNFHDFYTERDTIAMLTDIINYLIDEEGRAKVLNEPIFKESGFDSDLTRVLRLTKEGKTLTKVLLSNGKTRTELRFQFIVNRWERINVPDDGLLMIREALDFLKKEYEK